MADRFSADALRAVADAIARQQTSVTETAERTADPQKNGIGPWPYLALGAGSGADLWSSLDALSRVPGARETSPILRRGGRAGMVAAKTGGTAALMLLIRALAKKGHPKWAKGLGYGIGAGYGGLAAHNASLGR